MKQLMSVIGFVLLAGCGAEVATTAVTTAAMKKQEVDAAQQTKAMAQKKIDAAAQAIQQHAEAQQNADK